MKLSIYILYVNRLSKQDWRAFFMEKDGGNQKILKLSSKLERR
jgi:hypothetical protein